MDDKYTLENRPSLAKSTLPYGIAFGVIMILELVVTVALDIDAENRAAGMVMSLCNYVILPLLFIALACSNYKNKLNGGYISFSECIKAGVAVCVIAGLISGLGTAVIYAVSPEIKTELLEKTKIALAKNPGMTSEIMEQSIAMSEVFMRPYVLIPFMILVYAFIGLIMSLIVGAIIRKDNPGAFN